MAMSAILSQAFVITLPNSRRNLSTTTMAMMGETKKGKLLVLGGTGRMKGDPHRLHMMMLLYVI